MVRVYGRDAVEVEQPGGELVAYECRPVPSRPGFWREWLVVSPGGAEYRVSERPTGRWACSCPAFAFGGGSLCKHAEAVRRETGRG